ncbi:MAG: 50S ribosomal protein L3 [Candidatus Thiodiazotropha taylori]|nr:50S ribosomal protein L3 [Candidatus Thiodiazotropha taylori]MCG8075455.1 50S ribosomal protein L3 [Candidatus Thiodiazotropha taylori]MCW4307437.1 50S ribosomal protein L3 [Candidatus Thiodiazotropha endolucinida]MCW4332788.1 50S ribosomal protein L3 [Candidatus Thiodiazotropha endolucinida]
MAIGVVGRKAGMTRIFTEQGESIPVTVIEVEPNRVTQMKSDETDGYLAIQVTTGDRKSSRVNKPASGHFAKAGIEAGRGVWEFRAEESDIDGIEVGSEIKADRFEAGQIVDVRGRSQGKGYQGGVKRHNFRMQDATHGNSLSHRAPGSIGQCQTPGRVFKGKKMAGQMGAVQRCQQNLEVVRVDEERNLLLVKGSVPGSKGGDLIITPAVKMINKG